MIVIDSFLAGFAATIGVLVACIFVILLAALKVSSDCDDEEERKNGN